MRFVRYVLAEGFPKPRFCEMRFVRCVSVDLQPVSSMYHFGILTTSMRIICQKYDSIFRIDVVMSMHTIYLQIMYISWDIEWYNVGITCKHWPLTVYYSISPSAGLVVIVVAHFQNGFRRVMYLSNYCPWTSTVHVFRIPPGWELP